MLASVFVLRRNSQVVAAALGVQVPQRSDLSRVVADVPHLHSGVDVPELHLETMARWRGFKARKDFEALHES